MQALIKRYCQYVIPGLNDWPSYSQADTSRFWDGWQQRTPLATRFAFYFSLLLIHFYCLFFLLFGRTLESSFINSETSRLYLIRQAFMMVKTMACLAYFSDPEVHAISYPNDEGVLWRE